MTSILTDFNEYLKEQQEAREAALPVVVAQLQAIGRAIQSDLPETIESIEVEYSGCGDDGSMEEMRVLPLKEVPNGERKRSTAEGPVNESLHQGTLRDIAETYQPMKQVDHCDLPEKVTLTLPGEDEEQEYDVAEMIEEIAFETLRTAIQVGKSLMAKQTAEAGLSPWTSPLSRSVLTTKRTTSRDRTTSTRGRLLPDVQPLLPLRFQRETLWRGA